MTDTVGTAAGTSTAAGVGLRQVDGSLDDTLAVGDAYGPAQWNTTHREALLIAAEVFAARGFTVTVSDTVTIAQAEAITRGVRVLQALALADNATPVWIGGESASDTAVLGDALTPAWNLTLGDTVTMTELAASVVAMQVIEQLGIAAVGLGSAHYRKAVAETALLSGSAAPYWGAAVADVLAVADTVDHLRTTFEHVMQALALSDANQPQLLIQVAMAESIDITAAEALNAIWSGQISEEIEVRVGYAAPNDSFTAWAMNTRTAAVTEYQSFDFNSFGVLAGRSVAGRSDGLFELTGDTDFGAAIIATLKGGFLQFGGTHLSRLKEAYLATRGAGDFVLRIITGLGEDYHYAVSALDMRSTKINMGKGQRARYFAFELVSAGQDFDLDTLEFVPLVVQRRV